MTWSFWTRSTEVPEIFQPLRGFIDRRRRKGKRTKQFLLLGSASIDLMQQSSETLAGRIDYLELTPFPGDGDRARGAALDAWRISGQFFGAGRPLELRLADGPGAHLLERDLPNLGLRIPAETLRRFWEMLAHNHSQMLECGALAASLGVSGQTVARYLDILVDLLLVRRLQPWGTNAGKRLVRRSQGLRAG